MHEEAAAAREDERENGPPDSSPTGLRQTLSFIYVLRLLTESEWSLPHHSLPLLSHRKEEFPNATRFLKATLAAAAHRSPSTPLILACFGSLVSLLVRVCSEKSSHRYTSLWRI